MKKFAITIFSLLFAVSVLAALQKSTSIVSIEGRNYYVHTVVAGESVYSLAKLYEISEADMKAENPHIAEGLQVGHVLKIPVKEGKVMKRREFTRTFDRHVVAQGETSYSICKHYGITLDVLVEDNPGIDPLVLSVGQELNIRKTAMGEADVKAVNESVKDYTNVLAKVEDGFVYHLVAPKQTLYSLTRQYGVTEAQIAAYNDISDGLKAGQILKLPAPGQKQTVVSPPPFDGFKMDGRETTLQSDSLTGEPVMVHIPRSFNEINISVILPLKHGGEVSGNFMDLYRGILMGMRQLKSQGINVNLNVFNDDRTPEGTAKTVADYKFTQSDLIIGPVYETELHPVLDFARSRGVPVISPLGTVEHHKSNLLYQIYPSPATKYDKLKAFIGGAGDKNVVTVYAVNKDVEFERELRESIPHGAKRLDYYRKMPSTDIEHILSRDKENVFVFFMADESEIEEVMARISSIQNNLSARGAQVPSVSVVGTSRWQRFSNIDKNLYFKLRLVLVTPYFADKSNDKVALFDREYIRSFGSLPSLYSYRGYDVARLFAEAYRKTHGGAEFSADKAINELGAAQLQTPYRFTQESPTDKHINDQWALVKYGEDYTVTVE